VLLFFLHWLHRHADLLIKVNSLLSDVHVLAILQDPGLPGGELELVGAFQKAMAEHGLSGHQVGLDQHLLSDLPYICFMGVYQTSQPADVLSSACQYPSCYSLEAQHALNIYLLNLRAQKAASGKATHHAQRNLVSFICSVKFTTWSTEGKP